MQVPTIHHIRPHYVAWFTQFMSDKQEEILTSLGLDNAILPATPTSPARLMNFIYHVLADDQALLDKFCVAIEVEHLKSCAEEHRKEMQ